MTRTQQIEFELYVMEMAENDRCKTVEDLEKLSQGLHESIENAIGEICLDNGIEDYYPQY